VVVESLGTSMQEKTGRCGASPISKLPTVIVLHNFLVIKASYGRNPNSIPSVVNKIVKNNLGLVGKFFL
jgi:hypothetical protein